MGFFEGVGKAFANIGRWGEKQRIALHYGSDWEDRLNREQQFLDQYWAEKQQRDKEDRLRQQADEEEKKLQREEFARKRQYDAANDALGLFEKMQDSGATLADVDPGMLRNLPVPAEGLWTAAAESRGRRDAEAKAKAEKAALELQNIQSQIAHRAWEEKPKPEKGPAPERPRTRGQAEDDARATLALLNPSDPLTGQRTFTDPSGSKRPMTIEDILSLADKLQGKMSGAGRDTEDVLGSLSEPAAKLAKGVNPAQTGGNPAGNAAAQEPKKADLPPATKTASGPGGTIYLRGGVWYDAQGNVVK